MKNLKWVLIFGGGLAACVVVLAAVFFLGGTRDVDSPEMSVYFFNAGQGRLQPENRPWPEGDGVSLLHAAFAHMMEEPIDSALSSAFSYDWCDEVMLTDMYMGGEYGDTLIVRLADYYNNIAPLEDSLFRAAFTLTMTGLPFVEDVEFIVGDEHGRMESAATIANAPFISPARLSSAQLTLFFVDESMEGLVTEIYDAVDVDIQQRGLFALQRLIEGPQIAGAMSIIPPETRVRNVVPELYAGGIYVDLSSEFWAGFTGTPAQAQLMIYSIVNTVVYNSPGSLRRVFFLIDSDRYEHFHGVGDFKGAFHFNEGLIIYQAEGDIN